VRRRFEVAECSERSFAREPKDRTNFRRCTVRESFSVLRDLLVLQPSVRIQTYLLTSLLIVCISAHVLVPQPARADGFRILDQGAAATAQGAAFAAQADDPSAIHYNPAGMTQLPGVQLYGGVNLIGGSKTTTFTNLQGETATGGSGGAIANPPP